MNFSGTFDFPTILVLLSLITGMIWLIDIIFFAPRRKLVIEQAGEDADPETLPQEHWIVDTAKSLFPVIFVVLFLRSFVYEPFRIPSESMVPTLITGDFILVNKFVYGIRLPSIDTKIIDISSPERGDVAVFRYPLDPELDYIKRIVGLPGDHILYKNKVLYINGEKAAQIDMGPLPSAPYMRELMENLGGVEHKININVLGPDDDGEWTVPPGHYFGMGDNRNNSADSRVWGFIPEENLVGRADMIWLSFDFKNFVGDWGRIGNLIE